MNDAALTSVTDLRALLLADCEPLPGERCAILDASGRVVKHAISARRDLPGFDNSAMDGVGVRSADVAAASEATPVALRLLGASLPGTRPDALSRLSISAGQGVRIMTGAPVPPGVDAIVMREQCDESSINSDHTGTVRVRAPAPLGQHIRRTGEDVHSGQVVAPAGSLIHAARLNLLLAAGVTELDVVRAPRVCVLASGDELRDVGEPTAAFELVNSNAHAVAAAARQLCASVQVLGIARDSLDDHVAMIGGATACDLLITIGGVSAGTHDFVRPALQQLGAELVAFKVAMRPGKPLAYARLPSNATDPTRRVLALPGNPVSAMVSFVLFVAPLLRRLQGHVQVEPVTQMARLTAPVSKKAGLEFHLRAQLKNNDVTPLSHQGSHHLLALADSNALIVLPREVESVAAGSSVQCVLYPWM